MASQSIKALKIFHCCAPQDKASLNDLNIHLSGMKRQYELQTWHEDEIAPGVEREQEIDAHFDTAQIILLLISPDFIASDYCWEQINRALEKHREHAARVIPILVRPAHWENTPLRDLQVLPKNAVAISTYPDRDLAWLDVTKDICYVVESLIDIREKIPQQSYRKNQLVEQKKANRFFDPQRRKFIAVVTPIAITLVVGVATYKYFSIEPIQINIAHGPDKTQWLQAAKQVFDHLNNQENTYNGKQIQITLDPRGGENIIDSIVTGTLKPTVRLSSSLELAQLAKQWKSAHGNTEVVASSGNFAPQNLLLTPLVFGIWHSRAQALLKHYREITLTTIYQALTQQHGWSAIGGNPQWGWVKIGQTSPTFSTLGLLWIILMAYNFYNKQDNLTLTEIQNPRFVQYVGKIERAVSQFGRTSPTYIEQVVAASGSASYDIVLSEESVLLSDWQLIENDQREPLIIYYPNPTYFIDNTYAILQAPWVTSEQKEAALIFQKFLWLKEQQRLGLQYGFRPDNPTISLTDNVANNLFLAHYSANFRIQTPTSTVSVPPPDITNGLFQLWDTCCNNVVTAGG